MFTKTIQELFSNKNLPIQSYAVHPGLVNTEIYQHTSMRHLKILFNILFKVNLVFFYMKKINYINKQNKLYEKLISDSCTRSDTSYICSCEQIY